MLSIPAPFPQVGSYGFIDAADPEGREVVEPVRILRDNGDGTALVSLTGRRFPREIASSNRTIPFTDLRETEGADPTADHAELVEASKGAGRKRSRRR